MRIRNMSHKLINGQDAIYVELPKHYFNEWKKGRIYLNLFSESIGIGVTTEKFFIDSTNIMIMRSSLNNLGLEYDFKHDVYYDDNHGYPYISYKAVKDNLIDINCTIKDRGAFVDIIFETVE